jgi:hypothetical protein
MWLVQALTPAGKVKRHEFWEEMQLTMEEDGFVERLISSDEATFCISGKENRHNVCMWGTEQPHVQTEHQCDSPEVQKWTFSVRCLTKKCMAHFSSWKQLWLETHFWTCWKTGCCPNWIPIMAITFYIWTEFPPIFTRTYECFSIVFFHSAGSDVLQMETTTFSLGHPAHRILQHAIYFFRVH